MRSWIALAVAAVAAGAFVPLVQHRASAQGHAPATLVLAPLPALPAPTVSSPPARPVSPAALLGAIDLGRMQIGAEEVTVAGSSGRVAHLTIDPELQRTTRKILRALDAPQAAVVLLETATGRALVWADHEQKDSEGDPCVQAGAPAASVFKIVTAAALLEQAGLRPETKQCYSGGETRLLPVDLVDDPKRDRWCATMSEAMGRSLNAVFARLALKSLKPDQLTNMAEAFGFGQELPFDVAVEPSEVHIPDDDLGFARTAAGFWNTTLSPLQGALIASAIANGGEVVRPVLIESITDKSTVLYRAPERQVLRRAVRPETAGALTEMMETTVTSGTSYKAFHDAEGRPFLASVAVAGKTGTLSRPRTQQFYTWFVGFAPSRAAEVAVAVEVLNGPKWRAKANVVAREVLRAYFARKTGAKP
jgi:penicillin-binding protein A